MKKRKIGLVIGLIFMCLGIVLVYEIMDIAGSFQNYDRITEKRQVHRISDSGTETRNVYRIIDSGTERVTLTWDKVSNANLYNLYWSKSSPVDIENSQPIPVVKYQVTIGGLIHGVKYFFVVTAVNKFGESKGSNELPHIAGQ